MNDRVSLDSTQLSADLYERILDAYAPWLLEISFYLWGEPLLCRELPQFVELAQRHNIATTVSTNLNTQRSERLEELILSGLNHLIVCLDGMSEKTYQTIRIGGSYALAMGNLEHVVAARRKIRSRSHPSIEWQYVVTDFNKHELPLARRTAKELGIEVFTEIADWGRRGESDDLVEGRARMRKRIKDHCWWPWFGLAIQANGDVYPCCHTAKRKEWAILSLQDSDVTKIWNSAVYQDIRGVFHKNPSPESKKTICWRCPMV